jgi:5'-methylthioadenosine phosphorylase
MTNMPEARLAREAELCYASVAMVTDYDCWHPDYGHVEVSDIIEVLSRNAASGRALVGAVAGALGGARGPCGEGCDRALETALITAPEARDPELLRRLDAVAGRVLGAAVPG